MALPYKRALERIEHYCATYFESLSDASLDAKTRANLRERRDYWHAIGSRIRRRIEREAKRGQRQ